MENADKILKGASTLTRKNLSVTYNHFSRSVTSLIGNFETTVKEDGAPMDMRDYLHPQRVERLEQNFLQGDMFEITIAATRPPSFLMGCPSEGKLPILNILSFRKLA
ncbi:hypothetical protein J6590_032531 [Homalodisca vitripennis]|nr:hypothetical protein J6590_032531 [Homalodisca vitripennis]